MTSATAVTVFGATATEGSYLSDITAGTIGTGTIGSGTIGDPSADTSVFAAFTPTGTAAIVYGATTSTTTTFAVTGTAATVDEAAG